MYPSKSRLSFLTLSLVAGLAMAACRGDAKSEAQEESKAPPVAAEKRADPKPPSEEKEWNRRRVKEFDATADDALGTLAEGLGVTPGTAAPTASVQDATGARVELASLWKESDVLLVFYRGGWCPYCNSQMRDLTKAVPEFKKRGITPVAISVDSIDESAETQKTYEIPFPILADPDLAAHTAWNVTMKVSDEEFERLQGFGIDVEKASGKAHRTIGVPSIFLVDTSGVVQWAHGDPGYKVRPRAEQILRVLDARAAEK